MHFTESELKQVQFDTLSGVLTVKKDKDLLVMDFPSFSLKPVELTDTIVKASV